jgi:allophanate hydrolase
MTTADVLRELSFEMGALAAAYRSGTVTPADVVEEVLRRIADRGDAAIWIALWPRERLLAEAAEVARRREAGEPLPLYGVPFGVKDNIDVAGLPTTAACPAFAYQPERDAAVVARLRAAGALCVGKTNLDQFATGLVGTRSPYGVPRNAFDPRLIPGGSSSGSGVAVALGQVSFALGTDTAGSGRVPAAYGNVVGLKPSPGVLSTTGVVPACRSLDCVSVFALTCEDAGRVGDLARGYDATDPYARPEADAMALSPSSSSPAPGRFRFGVPAAGERQFFGDAASADAYAAALAQLAALGGEEVTVDLAPFLEAGAMLYGGPFVAERLEAAGALLARAPGSILPVTRAILEGARQHRAVDAFAALGQLRALRRRAAEALAAVDFLALPTAPTIYTVAAVVAEPLALNANLGRYTAFVNLLDLAALAVPAGMRAGGLPFGVTLIGPWGSDARLGAVGSALHRATSTHLGATGWPLPPASVPAPAPEPAPPPAPPETVSLVVVGAHLSGEPLNHQLTDAGGELVRATRTAPVYRLYALPGTVPPKPGLVRIADGDVVAGGAIAVEVWALGPAAFGRFVARVPAPLCIGIIELEDGTRSSGFLCEAHAVADARDITSFGGWREFRNNDALQASASQSMGAPHPGPLPGGPGRG